MIWEKAPGDNRTAVLYMDHVHNPDTVKTITGAIDEIVSDGNIRSVVLASRHDKNWCTGLDIPWIMAQYKAGDREAIKHFFMSGAKSVFLRLLEIPVVTIAAITGHTYGNGVIIALLCDTRIMRSDRGYFCLPEASMGLEDAFTPSMLKLMDLRYDPFIREVMIPTAKKFAAPELVDKKIVDLACDSREAVMEAALARAREISSDDAVYRSILDDRKKWGTPVIEAIKTEDDPAFDHIIGRFWDLMTKMG